MKTLVVLCALASVAIAGPRDKAKPKAESTQAQADALFEKGQASYQAGQYQEAIEEFKQAFALVKDPVYLFNVAQSYRKVADCVERARLLHAVSRRRAERGEQGQGQPVAARAAAVRRPAAQRTGVVPR